MKPLQISIALFLCVLLAACVKQTPKNQSAAEQTLNPKPFDSTPVTAVAEPLNQTQAPRRQMTKATKTTAQAADGRLHFPLDAAAMLPYFKQNLGLKRPKAFDSLRKTSRLAGRTIARKWTR